jgi:hypothetical protein
MSDQSSILDKVVHDFVASLSPSEKLIVGKLIRNSQIAESWVWYKVVLSRYLEGPHAAALVNEIEARHPGGELFNSIEFTKGVPVYEASIILKEAQRVLNDPHFQPAS